MVLHHTWEGPKRRRPPAVVSSSHDRVLSFPLAQRNTESTGGGLLCALASFILDTTSRTGPHLLVSSRLSHFLNPRLVLLQHCGRPCDGSGISSARFCPPDFPKHPPAFRGGGIPGMDRFFSLGRTTARGSYIEPGLCGSSYPISSCEI